MSTRRAFLLVAASSLSVGALACKRPARCATCGMKIDPASTWSSELAVGDERISFDTPHCAFEAWRTRYRGTGVGHFREYYTQQMTPHPDLRFVSGSDVIGPMGPDVVAVGLARARIFARDHNGAPPLTADEVLEGKVP